MIAVLFEVVLAEGREGEYLAIAESLRGDLDGTAGFVSIERFRSLGDPAKLLSLSFWRDEDAVSSWRNHESHRLAQAKGRDGVFADYRLRIAAVVRDYGMRARREQAPADSRARNGG
jgi:heme-degrading monooxygenase HmoA